MESRRYISVSDKELAARCADADEQARRELYERYARRLYGLALRYCADAQRARDLMHDAMIRVYERIGRYEYRGEGSLYSWIARLTIALCVDDLRRRSRVRFVDIDDGLNQMEDPPADDVATIPPEVLRKMIDGLPQVRRTVFNLYYIDGLPHKEIASLLGIKENASTSIAAKARAQLAKEIRSYIRKNE